MNGKPEDTSMGPIVRTVSRWLSGFILAYGIYVVLHGHLTPGGGFDGGLVMACSFVLLTLAGGETLSRARFSRRAALGFASAGVLLFLALACAGLVRNGDVFFRNFIATPEEARFTLFSAGLIPLSNIAIGLKVASSLFLAFAVLAAFRIAPDRERKDEEDA